jgi:uncharacterized protein (DUF342 family)
VKLNVDKSKLTASLTISDPEKCFPDRKAILNLLNDYGITDCILYDKIDDIICKKKKINNETIANAFIFINDNKGGFHFNFDENLLRPNNENSPHRIDYKRAAKTVPIKKDEALFSLTEGFTYKAVNLQSEKIHITQDVAKYVMGENVYLGNDGKTIYANMDGYIIYRNQKFHVIDIYHVNSNVGYATGNIKFNGSVVIEGDVRSGFRVEAEGDIFISGNVDAAYVYSQSGNINIGYGVIGMGKAKILAGGALTSGFIQDAAVGVRGDVLVKHYIINSAVSSGGDVLLMENEAMIRGGAISSGKSVVAKTIGAEKKINTDIRLTNIHKSLTQSSLWEYSRRRAELSMKLSLLEKRLSFLNLLNEKGGRLSKVRLNEIDVLKHKISKIKIKKNLLEKKEREFQRKTIREQSKREIVVKDKIFPNVNIEIDGQYLFTEQEQSSVKYFLSAGTITEEKI